MTENLFYVVPFEKDPIKKIIYAESGFNGFNGTQNHLGKYLLPPDFAEIAHRVQKVPIRSDDLWLVSFPRTGSTWCQEMIWLIANNLNFEEARSTVQQLRAPLLESMGIPFEHVDSVNNEIGVKVPRYKRCPFPLEMLPEESGYTKSKLIDLFTDSISFVNSLPSPRFVKSHLPLEMLPEDILTVKPKLIYVMRNPKDLCVSLYFHCQVLHSYKMEFDHFCELFLNDMLPLGSIFRHYMGFWKMRDDPNVLILKYEDMKSDTKGTIKKIAKFLEKPLTERQVEEVYDFLSFQNMRDSKASNLQVIVDNKQGEENFYKKSGRHFIRKGIVGDHKNYMSKEMIEKFDLWIEQNTRGTGLSL